MAMVNKQRCPNQMKCLICRQGETEKGQTTVTLERGESAIIVRGVPADVCANCGEYYLEEEAARKVMSLAESAVQRGAEVEILHYAA